MIYTSQDAEYQPICIAEARVVFPGAIIETHSELYLVTSIHKDEHTVTIAVKPMNPVKNPLLSMRVYKGYELIVHARVPDTRD